MSKDRLAAIFQPTGESLDARYDEWAATYDDDNADWGWRGAELAHPRRDGDDQFVVTWRVSA